MSINVTRAGLLYDYAQRHLAGFTWKAAANYHGWRSYQTGDAIRALRRILAESDINLVADPNGHRAPWLYRLVGGVTEAKGWVKNRSRDLETRLVTIGSIAKSLVAATDGRSLEGKRARLISKTMDALEAQLAAIDGQLDV